MIEKELQKKENPLFSLIFNILFPVIILRNGSEWLTKLLLTLFGESWYKEAEIVNDIPSIVFLIALLFPLIYFFIDLQKTRNINFISIIGFVNVLLTGGIGVFGSRLGLSRNWFILKEGLLPMSIGVLLIFYARYKPKSFNSILLNNAIFDLEKIHGALSDQGEHELDRSTRTAGYHLIAGFFISSLIQFVLASFIVVSDPGDENFNKEVSTMTWVSYLAVMVPTMVVLGKGFWGLMNDIERITKLDKEEFMKG
mgnify:FL=1